MEFKVGDDVLFVRLDDGSLPYMVNDKFKYCDKRQLHAKFWPGIAVPSMAAEQRLGVMKFERMVCVGARKVTKFDLAEGSSSSFKAVSEADGFLFTDAAGVCYYNQYPYARSDRMEPGADGMVFEDKGRCRYVAVKYCYEYLKAKEAELYADSVGISCTLFKLSPEERSRLSDEQVNAVRQLYLVKDWICRLEDELLDQFNLKVEQL